MQDFENNGDTKTRDQVYHDRNLLAIAFAQTTARPSGYRLDPDDENWAIVWVKLRQGEVSWHVPRAMAERYLPSRDRFDGFYDGCDRAEKNRRLRQHLG